jgi:hypothetical protein
MFDRHKQYMDSCGNRIEVIFKGFGIDTDAVVITPDGSKGVGHAYGRGSSSVEAAVAEAKRAAEESNTCRVSH